MSEKQVKFSELMRLLRASLAKIPEHRRGANGHYEIADAGLAAFAVFFMQEPSFLAYQTNMQAKHGHYIQPAPRRHLGQDRYRAT